MKKISAKNTKSNVNKEMLLGKITQATKNNIKIKILLEMLVSRRALPQDIFTLALEGSLETSLDNRKSAPKVAKGYAIVVKLATAVNFPRSSAPKERASKIK